MRCIINAQQIANILLGAKIFFFSWQGEGGSKCLWKGLSRFYNHSRCRHSRFLSSYLLPWLGDIGQWRPPWLRWNPRFQSKEACGTVEKDARISSVETVLRSQERLGKTWNLVKGKPWEENHSSDLWREHVGFYRTGDRREGGRSAHRAVSEVHTPRQASSQNRG